MSAAERALPGCLELRDGVVLLDRDRSARLRFEVRTRNVHFDLEPVLTRYRKRALERAAAPS